MALSQRLEFRQSQSLVMTPQLMQAIKLLQLSNLDLTTFVEEELERNPCWSGPMTRPVAGTPRLKPASSTMATISAPAATSPAVVRARPSSPARKNG